MKHEPTLSFPTVEHQTEFCVVGGGLSGLCTAIAAARNGTQTILVQDRPVLGGNASSEVRMWICGAHGKDNIETGILEEIKLENCHRNPQLKYTIWDSVLYEKAHFQPNLKLMLNCSINEVKTSGNKISEIAGWQLTTQTRHVIKAKFFADCSGDSVLRVCGAELRRGREAREEFNEAHAPETPDRKTMGNSLLLQVREIDPEDHVPFVKPKWANTYEEEQLPHRGLTPGSGNWWWLEIGGEYDTIGEGEELRDELYKIGFGVWDMIKNHPDGRGKKWELEWIGSLPGKRENFRYVGDVIMNQNDVEAEGKYEDMVAYGGWSMDDHHPAGINYVGKPTIFHPAPSPYGITYRCLYSANIDNLFMAGRNISVTHMALSSTRVMATCAIIGQAVGTAAALAVKHNTTPRGVGQQHITELQNTLMDQDCYLPWHSREIPAICKTAKLTASNSQTGSDPVSLNDVEQLRTGIDRSLGKEDNAWLAGKEDWASYSFDSQTQLTEARITFDSDLSRPKKMPARYPKKGNWDHVPATMVKVFSIQTQDATGNWQTVAKIDDNYQRLVRVPLNVTATAVRLVIHETWGDEQVKVFAFDVQ
jgi:hypothetical protein